MSAPTKRYRIHTSLQDFEGAKSGRFYTCTTGAIYTAPEGDFKELPRGAYSLISDAAATPQGDTTGNDTTGDDPTDES